MSASLPFVAWLEKSMEIARFGPHRITMHLPDSASHHGVRGVMKETNA